MTLEGQDAFDFYMERADGDLLLDFFDFIDCCITIFVSFFAYVLFYCFMLLMNFKPCRAFPCLRRLYSVIV